MFCVVLVPPEQQLHVVLLNLCVAVMAAVLCACAVRLLCAYAQRMSGRENCFSLCVTTRVEVFSMRKRWWMEPCLVGLGWRVEEVDVKVGECVARALMRWRGV